MALTPRLGLAMLAVCSGLWLPTMAEAAAPKPHEPGGANYSAEAAFEVALGSNLKTAHSFLNATGVGAAISPECPTQALTSLMAGGAENVAQCTAEYEYKGSEYIADGTVTPAQIHNDQTTGLNTGSIDFVSHWIRRWRTCKSDVIPGRLTGNLPGCESDLITQYFEYAGRVHYSFKRHIYILGTGTGSWPDFYEFGCSWSHKTYQCSTRVGDEFRWQPSS